MEKRDCMVSIMCAAFNHEAYLRSALEGFVSQKTDFPFEVLINDDKSHDGTADIIREYAARYPEIIRPFYQEINLYSLGKNADDECFYPAARGKYVAFCEGDDYWTDPLKLQKQVDFLESHPDYSACVHNSTVHDCSGREPDRPFISRTEEHDISFEEAINGMSHAFHTSSILARTDILSKHPDFYYIGCKYSFTDFSDAMWILLNGKVHFIGESMSVYRLCSNPGSWSSNMDGQYQKRIRFITGEIEIYKALKAHVNAQQLPLVEQALLEKEYELLYLEGRVDEMVKPPYDKIYKSRSLPYRAKITVKRLFPGLHEFYRNKRGFK